MTAAAGGQGVDGLVDTERYPLTDPGGQAWAETAARAHEQLEAEGCCVLPGFVRHDVLDRLRREGEEMAPSAHHEQETVNVYNSAPDPSLPADHPVNTRMERGNAFVPRQAVPTGAVVSRLYTSAALQAFVAACAGLPRVHELADPLAGLCLNVLAPGRSHPWHFDTNELAVSLLTSEPGGGGVFEHCPAIRSPTSEGFPDVAAVLAGRGEHLVRRLTLRPGDLQLFRGRYSLHRVTAVAGRRPRHTAIFAYTERAGVLSTPERTRQLFGTVLPAHLAASGRGARVDALLD